MVKTLQAQLAEKVVVTAEGQFMKLEDARRNAARDGAHSAVVSAIGLQNRLFGLEKQTVETTVRVASRAPGVPKEVELSIEDWRRQQLTGLLPRNGGMDADERDVSVNRNGSTGNSNGLGTASPGSGAAEGGDGDAFAHDDHRESNGGGKSCWETGGGCRPAPCIIDMYADDDD